MLTLTNLLPEMIRGIASHLPDIDHTRLRITCKTLYAKVGEARKLGEEGMLPLRCSFFSANTSSSRLLGMA